MAKRHARKQTVRHPSARPLLRKPPSVVTLGVVSSVSEHKVQPTPVKTGTGPPKGMLPPEMEWYVKEDGTWGTRLKSQFRDSKPVPVKVRTPIMEDKYYNPIRPKTEPKQGYVWAKASPFITGVDSITGLPLRGSISYPGGEVPNYIYLQVPEQFATATSTGLWEYGYEPLPTLSPVPTPKPIPVPTPSPTPKSPWKTLAEAQSFYKARGQKLWYNVDRGGWIIEASFGDTFIPWGVNKAFDNLYSEKPRKFPLMKKIATKTTKKKTRHTRKTTSTRAGITSIR